MQTVLGFLLFFLVFPAFIALLRILYTLMPGPRDNSLYSQQRYRDQLRQALLELAIVLPLLLAASACLISAVILDR